MGWSAGIDWGTTGHAACVLDGDGHIAGRWRVEHTAAGLEELLQRLGAVTAPAALPVAVEQAAGVLVDRLRAAGHPVVVMPSSALAGFRARYRARRRKSDPEDAYILADVLRTDGHRFRPTPPRSEVTRVLRTLTRGRRELVRERVRLTNRLCAVLACFWPGVSTLFDDVSSPIALAFLRRYPTPTAAARLTAARLSHFLHRQRYSGPRTGAALLAQLRAAAPPTALPAEEAAQARLVASYVTLLAALHSELRQVRAAIAAAVTTHPDHAVITSFPGVGPVTAAQMLAELGDDHTRFPTPARLAAEAGVVPVTASSGKHRGVYFRWACNKPLREAVGWLAANSRRHSAWADALYRRARERGCRHSHALRIVGRAWLRILWRCWQSHTLYDPARHGGALAAATG